MILITPNNDVKELEYPDEGLKSWKKLKEHIGNRCELIEHVQPKRLYTEIGAGIEFCEMSEEQFNLIFPRLKDCEKKLKEERENI